MKTKKIFKWVWNINGAMILGMTFFVVGEMLVNNFFIEEAYTEEIETLDLAEDLQGIENWNLGYPQAISGSDFYYLPLESDNKEVKIEQKISGLYGIVDDYYTTRSKNVIFINNKSNESHWLFDSVEQIIVNMLTLDARLADQPLITKAIYYEVLNSDSNSDGIVDTNDKLTFSLTKNDGSNYKEIISGYNRIIKADLNASNNLFVLYVNNNEVFSMIIELENFSIISQTQLPKVKS